jgi:phosphoribosylformylglycinamidine (FGAM) synthase-like amidotransferase family enzyme
MKRTVTIFRNDNVKNEVSSQSDTKGFQMEICNFIQILSLANVKLSEYLLQQHAMKICRQVEVSGHLDAPATLPPGKQPPVPIG